MRPGVALYHENPPHCLNGRMQHLEALPLLTLNVVSTEVTETGAKKLQEKRPVLTVTQ